MDAFQRSAMVAACLTKKTMPHNSSRKKCTVRHGIIGLSQRKTHTHTHKRTDTARGHCLLSRLICHHFTTELPFIWAASKGLSVNRFAAKKFIIAPIEWLRISPRNRGHSLHETFSAAIRMQLGRLREAVESAQVKLKSAMKSRPRHG